MMNAGHLIGFFWLGLVVVLYTLLIWRNVFINERFRFLVTVSGSALTLGAALNWLRAFENYPRWFLPNVYPALEWVFVALIAVGVITLFLGLISEFGSFRRGRETAAVSRASPEPPRQPRSAVRSSSFVSACAALRRELERPLAVIELGTVALHRLLSGLSLRSGALYVLNEAGSQLALVAADGLAPEDQALFERLRADDALVVKSLDESIPAISAVEDWTGLSAEARSSIVLTLPLISQGESLGLALLFSEQTLALSGAEREEISEMGRMIAEKLLLARLRGQLSRQSATATRNESDHRAWSERTDRALAALDQPEGCRALCDAFVGIGGAERAGFFAQESDFDSLALVGASDGFPALSDGFRRAIGQGIVRATPALLNQSGANRVGSTGGRRTRRTVGLVYPLRAVAGDTRRYALILLRQDGEFALTQREFSHLQSLISVAQAVLGARVRRGRLERQRDVLRGAHQLLSAVPTGAGSRQTTADFFATITSLLPVSAVALLYENEPRGRLRVREVYGIKPELAQDIIVLPGEGSVGRVAALSGESLSLGRERLMELADEYDMLNRDIFGEAFGAFGNCEAEILIPLAPLGRTEYVLAVYLQDQEPAAEIMRSCGVLSLAQSLLLCVCDLRAEHRALNEGHGRKRDLGLLINSLNNDLLAIVGNCQMAERDPNLSGAQERALRVVRERAEHAAATLLSDRIYFGEDGGSTGPRGPEDDSGCVSLSAAMRKFADEYLVGEQILLAEGRAREVAFNLRDDFATHLPEEMADSLVKSLTMRFVPLAEESEMVTVSAYHDGAYQYLTFSRHRRNFPPLNAVDSLGHFRAPGGGLVGVPDSLAAALRTYGFEVAIDEDNDEPAFLSLRAEPPPTRPQKNEDGASPFKIMAIDDQSMILDLLQAMCQTLGYDIETFESAVEALEAFDSGAYDIVVTDLAMPELSGWDVARHIKARRPETHLIFITGWREGVGDEELDAAGVDQVLYKPFRLEQLTEALERVHSGQLSA